MVEPQIGFQQPVEELRPFIASYSFTEIADGGKPVHALLMPAWANIRFILSGEWAAILGAVKESSRDITVPIFGPTSRACVIAGYPPTKTIGVALLPQGWARFIAKPADRYADRIVPLQEIFGSAVDALRERLCTAPSDDAARLALDEFFLGIGSARPSEQIDLITRAHELLLNPAIVTADQFAKELAVSGRHLARLSREIFGFPPKLLLRRQRFLRTLGRMRANLDVHWGSLLDDAYSDQPHFVREFRRFMGVSPTEYFALHRHYWQSITGLRRQSIGPPLQGLQKSGRNS